MKKIIIALAVMAVIFSSIELRAETKNKIYFAKYRPVANFLEEDSTLSKWYKLYIDTTESGGTFKDFLKKLSNSEVLWQRGIRAGLTHNQLYSPIIGLMDKDMNDLSDMNEKDRAAVRDFMLQLDVALAAIDSTLPTSAREEGQIEVFRGAKPLRAVAEAKPVKEDAKKPISAVEAMTFTLMTHKLSDRINEKSPVKAPQNAPRQMDDPRFENPYRPW